MDAGRHASNADRGEYLRALDGLDFPASRDAIVRKATDVGGLDSEVAYVLERIDARAYNSLDDVMTEVLRVYADGARLRGPAPAAPASPQKKDATARLADPRGGEPVA